jgi:hypothetical protein
MGCGFTEKPVAPSFYQADKRTHRRVMVVGLLLCAVFVVVSFSLRSQPEDSRALVKADRLVRTAGEHGPAN